MFLLLFAAFRNGNVRRRFWGSLRLFAYVVTIALVLTAVCVHRARAALGEQSVFLGQELKPIADLLRGTTRLRLNGESLYVSMTTLPHSSVAEVLDRFEAVCREHPGPFAQRLLAASRIVPAAMPGAALVREALSELALNREQTPDHGALFCLTQPGNGARARDPLEQFMTTSDLGELGDLRYVTVSHGERAQGEQDVIKVVTLWTEGQFRLDRLGPPETGDAPGSDSRLAPRPPGSTRLFTAEAVDAPYAVRVYETSVQPAGVLAFYERTLSDSLEVPPFEGQEETGRAFLLHGQPLLVMTTRDDAHTTVTLSELGSRGESAMPAP